MFPDSTLCTHTPARDRTVLGRPLAADSLQLLRLQAPDARPCGRTPAHGSSLNMEATQHVTEKPPQSVLVLTPHSAPACFQNWPCL